jgi:hypothetical protein
MLPSPYYPVYPQGDVNITPLPSDMIVEALYTGVYTPLTVSSLKTLTDPITNNDVIGGATVQTAPTTGNASSIVGSGVQQLEPVVVQSSEPTLKQNVKKVGRLGSTDQLYGFGTIDTSLKSNLIMSQSTTNMLQQMLYEPYGGNDSVEPGYTASEIISTPIPLFASMILTDPVTDDILGFHKFQGCQLSPGIPGIKDGSEGTFTLDFTIAEKPILLTPNALSSAKTYTQLSLGPVMGSAHSAITNVVAVLEDEYANPVSGKTVSFNIAGQAAGTATTNSSGIATLTTFTPSPSLSAGVYNVEVNYAGSTTYAASSDSNSLTLT